MVNKMVSSQVKHIKCPYCGEPLARSNTWKPQRGMDPGLRAFRHDVEFNYKPACHTVLYVIVRSTEGSTDPML